MDNTEKTLFANEIYKIPSKEEKRQVKIWAHRGLSMNFPENTLISFLAAAKVPGITGIELDVQRTKDGQLVVFHDETVDRVTEGTGQIAEQTLDELQRLKFKKDVDAPKRRAALCSKNAGIASLYKEILGDGLDYSELSDNNSDYADFSLHVKPFIPTMEQVLYALKPYCENGLLINIELKTSIVRYPGIEKEVYDLVNKYGLQKNIVYSSFLAESIKEMKRIDPSVKTGMLARKLSKTIKEGICGDPVTDCDAFHPYIVSLLKEKAELIDKAKKDNSIIRVWNMEEPLYNSGKKLCDIDYRNYCSLGVTDVIINTAEKYLMM